MAFLSSNFSYELVATHSSTTTPTFYRATAIWSSQEGSLLFWVLLLSIWSSTILFFTRRRARDRALCNRGPARHRGLLLRRADLPRDALRARSAPLREGVGLNPLLRHPAMMFHPPMLYSGYTLFTIPFAFAVGALIDPAASTPSGCAPSARSRCWRVALPRGRDRARCAVVVLGARMGRLLGMGRGRERWLMPAADRHGVPALGDGPGEARDAEGVERLARARDGHTRDPRHLPGALRASSIRSTPSAPRRSGVPFLGLIIVLVGGSGRAGGRRGRPSSVEHRRIRCCRARRSSFNNLGAGRALLRDPLGHLLLLSEAVTGSRASVGPPWFGRYTVPLALLLVFLAGLGPVDGLAPHDRGQPEARIARSGESLPPSRSWCCSPPEEWPTGRPAAPASSAWRVRGGRRGPGVLAGSTRAARRCRRLGAGGGRVARAPQPSSLRRLLVHAGRHRPARGRGRFLDFPGRPRRATGAGSERARRRLRGHLPAADEHAERRPNGSLEKLDLGADLRVRRGTGRPGPFTRSAATSPPATPPSVRCRVTSRARRPARSGSSRACAATSGPRSRRTRGLCAGRSRRGTEVIPGGRRLPAAQRSAALGAPCAGSWRSYPRTAPARHVPDPGVAARDLDLARRADRLRGWVRPPRRSGSPGSNS